MDIKGYKIYYIVGENTPERPLKAVKTADEVGDIVKSVSAGIIPPAELRIEIVPGNEAAAPVMDLDLID